MRLEHYKVDGLKKEIIAIVSKYLDLKEHKLFFFGSRVSGNGNEHSDIDIGIEGKEQIPYDAMSNIKEKIENLATLYKIEIVDFKTVSDDFREVALKNIELIL